MKTDHETAHLLRAAAAEIRLLRRANQEMAEKLRVVEIFERALMGPPRSMGAGLDYAWACDDRANKIELADEDAAQVRGEADAQS